MDRVYLSDRDFKFLIDHTRQGDDFYFAGTHSLTIPALKSKYILASACREWPDKDGVIDWLTPGEAARTELDRSFKDKIKPNCRSGDIPLLDKLSPRFWSGNPVKSMNMAYIDLKGAYHQIYKWLTMDTAWPLGIGQYPLLDVALKLQDWKAARNSVVGISRARTISCGKGSKSWEQSFKNRYLNPSLWYVVQDFLHELAFVACLRKCLYVATDCYIFDLEAMNGYAGYLSFKRFLDDHDLVYRLVTGSGHIDGFGSYRVGSKQTYLNAIEKQGGGKQSYVDWSGKATIDWWLAQKREVECIK